MCSTSRLFLSVFNARAKQMDTVSRFEDIITALKKPILDATDNAMTSSDSAQNVESVLEPVGERMSEIYAILVSILQGAPSESAGDIKTLLDQKGILSDLQGNPALKQSLIESANLLLKEYPYTRREDHAHTLQATRTASVSNIVPNNDITL
jgi:hypothetical protein